MAPAPSAARPARRGRVLEIVWWRHRISASLRLAGGGKPNSILAVLAAVLFVQLVCSSSSERYFVCWSSELWAVRRVTLASISVGPSPARARATASRDAL